MQISTPPSSPISSQRRILASPSSISQVKGWDALLIHSVLLSTKEIEAKESIITTLTIKILNIQPTWLIEFNRLKISNVNEKNKLNKSFIEARNETTFKPLYIIMNLIIYVPLKILIQNSNC